ncbi:MAG: hypothetical protein KBF66_18705 [Rhodoferax sp.]|uniref:hypothetical protein n=1 Tax=Rhodoferax sp. TaxID=50421 RepID=UPI001B4E9151|nr:hypothetical protein [Rhodoferax sp.]MBP9907581.1 hypothetical protein [Rhodoferax sp.]
MLNSLRRTLTATALGVVLLTAGMAFAADPVTDAMQGTSASYRVAMFKLSGQSLPEATEALTAAQKAWDSFRNQVGSKPGAPYDRDAEFAASVAKVSAIFSKAQSELAAGQAGAAHTALKEVRSVIADLRRRSNVVVYADQIHAYHLQMETVLIDGKAMLEQPKGMLQVTAQVGALSYLANRLRTQAPAELLGKSEFAAMVDAVNGATLDLQNALLAQDMAAVKDAMGKLKGPYSKLFAKFG